MTAFLDPGARLAPTLLSRTRECAGPRLTPAATASSGLPRRCTFQEFVELPLVLQQGPGFDRLLVCHMEDRDAAILEGLGVVSVMDARI